MSEDVLHDFRPGVYPGVDELVNHLVNEHGVERDRALASNLGLLHRMCHSWSEDPSMTHPEAMGER